MLVYLFYPNFHDIICRSSTPVALSEREVEWLGDSITARKYCLYIPKDNSTVRSINYLNLHLHWKKKFIVFSTILHP